MRRTTIISAFLGTLIEVYDFSVFPFLVPILCEVIFPDQPKSLAFNLTMLSYFVSYLIKPFGALCFGHLIDKYGRKRVLLLTTVLMTLATSTIGVLPVKLLGLYYGVGLILCRIIQGLSISGEFTSAIIMSVEQGRKYPALIGSMAFVGGTAGLFLANLSIYILLFLMPHDLIIQYAWRMPFLFGAIACLVLVGIRRQIDESSPEVISPQISYKTIVRSNKKSLVTVFTVSSLSASAFYITFIFLPTFLAKFNIHSHEQSLQITLVALIIYLVILPLGGLLADKIGVVRQLKIASILYLLFSYMVFVGIPQINMSTNMYILIFFAAIQALLNSALPAFMVNQFPRHHRGRALALSYNLSLTIFAGLMPYLILTAKDYINPGFAISICAVFSLLSIHFIGGKNGNLRSEFSY